MKHPVIALLTDFGLQDHYVAAVKGVVLSSAPNVNIVDVSHLIRPQNIKEGAIVLNGIFGLFPKNTVYTAIVDPGVGSGRKVICVNTERGYLLGPDNGILSLAMKRVERVDIRSVENSSFFRKPVSATFHGRDIFAPVAAALCLKNVFTKLGPRISQQKITQLSFPSPAFRADELTGLVIYIDRFGNAATNISKSAFVQWIGAKQSMAIHVAGRQIKLIYNYYSESKSSDLMALWNSSGMLEFAVPNKPAASEFNIQDGDVIKIRRV